MHGRAHALLREGGREARRQQAAVQGGRHEALEARALPQPEGLRLDQAVELREKLPAGGGERLGVAQAVPREQQQQAAEGEHAHLRGAAVEGPEVEVGQHQRPAQVRHHAGGQVVQDLRALLRGRRQAQQLQPGVLEELAVLAREPAHRLPHGGQRRGLRVLLTFFAALVVRGVRGRLRPRRQHLGDGRADAVGLRRGALGQRGGAALGILHLHELRSRRSLLGGALRLRVRLGGRGRGAEGRGGHDRLVARADLLAGALGGRLGDADP
mmetsp:Transcript_55894/g.173123  ORF Transcript_55894/g.173123 Transcript_55894/m.173123 type:complete len:269 (+) Transcript_55894:566-1372(+)